VLEVTDDGAGFDAAQPRSGKPHGLGLLGMRERLTLVGGELAITSARGKGTRIVAVVPLERHFAREKPGIVHAEPVLDSIRGNVKHTIAVG
jgi:signal transduction histidine kinase